MFRAGRYSRVRPFYSTALRREEIANLLVTDVDTDGGYVFVREGKGSKDRRVWHVVRKYVKLAGLEKTVSTHTFRHTCATHMLRNESNPAIREPQRRAATN